MWVALLLVLVSCGAAAGPMPERPPHLDVATGLVLRLEDVAPGAIVMSDDTVDPAHVAALLGLTVDSPDFVRLGFEGAYSREFAWAASSDHPRVLASMTMLFKDGPSAHRVLSSIDKRSVASRTPSFSVGAPIGDETVGSVQDATVTTAAGERTESTVFVAFRHANALSIVLADGLEPDEDPLAVVALARRQLSLQLAVAPRGIPLPPDPRPVHATSDKHVFASELVLVAADLPAGMRLAADGPMSATDFASGDADLEAALYDNRVQQTYGRRFTRKPQFGKEPTSITSATAVFYDSEGAHRSFDAMGDSMSANRAVLLGGIDVGDEAVIYRFDQRADDATYIDVLLRHRNALGLIEIRFEGDGFNASLALSLAERLVSYALADMEMLKPFP